MLSDKKHMEIANVCYANVSMLFAMFCNDSWRGPNFKWSSFCDKMEREADLWMLVHDVHRSRGAKDEINKVAREYARDIASRMIRKSGFVEKEMNERDRTNHADL